MLCSGRDPQRSLDLNLLDAVPATVSESSVESFLKGFRSQVEMEKDGKRKLPLEKENKGGEEKVKEERAE